MALPPHAADSILAAYLQHQHQFAASSLKSKHRPAPTKPALLYKTAAKSTGDSPSPLEPELAGPDQENRRNPARPSNSLDQEASGAIVQIQRKLLAFFYVYATVIVSLYLTYAVYCYHQQGQLKRQQLELDYSARAAQQQQQHQHQQRQSTAAALASASLTESGPGLDGERDRALQELQAKLDAKLHLLERFIEVLALDLEATKARLGEREKCACPINCSFNGTRYQDGQSWRQGCDECACRAGKISCQARECPKLACALDKDSVVQQLPGQCCPSCMKKCKVNKTTLKHGHVFRPTDPRGFATKECRCNNGLIKCEPIAPRSAANSTSDADRKRPQQQQLLHAALKTNKTIEYLKSILGSKLNSSNLDRPPTPAQATRPPVES